MHIYARAYTNRFGLHPDPLYFKRLADASLLKIWKLPIPQYWRRFAPWQAYAWRTWFVCICVRFWPDHSTFRL